MAKIMIKTIITLLLLIAPLQAQNTWVSGGGGDTTGIVHNAIRIKGIFISLIPPTDNQILKYDAASDSFLLETDAGGLAVADFLDSLNNYDGDIVFTQGVSTVADNSVDGTDIALGSDAQGDVMYYNGTDWARLAAGAAGRVLSTNGGGSNPTWEIDATSASGSDSIFHTATIHDLDLDTLFFDPEGFAAGATNGVGTRVLQYKDGSDELFAIDSLGAVVAGIWTGTVDSRVLLLSAILDSLNNYDNDIIFTQGNASYAANSVSSDELNATGVESELEAVMDLEDMQGAVTDGQVPNNITVTNYLLLSAILDSLNNYDGDILFTQGVTTYSNFLDSLNNYDNDVLFTQGITLLAANVVANAEMTDNAIRDAELNSASITQDSIFALSSNGFLERTAANTYSTTAVLADGDVNDNITVTNYLLLAAILDSLNNYDNDVLFTQGVTLLNTDAVSANELNATGVEAELEAVLDLPELQGLLSSTQVDSVGGNGIVTHTQLAEYDTIMVELNAAAWDTTSSTGKATSLAFNSSVGFAEGYWSFATITADSLIISFDLPDYFSSFVRMQVVIETEDTTADTLFVHGEGFADDENHALDVALASAAATLNFNTVTTNNDINIAEDFSIVGTYAAGDHMHLLLRRASTDEGVIRFLGLKVYVLRAL